MKKSYIIKNVLKGLNRYLVIGWEYEHFTSLCGFNGDFYYFHHTGNILSFNDFAVRFGSRAGGDIMQDIDVFRVKKDDNDNITEIFLDDFVHLKDLSLTEIMVDLISIVNSILNYI